MDPNKNGVKQEINKIILEIKKRSPRNNIINQFKSIFNKIPLISENDKTQNIEEDKVLCEEKLREKRIEHLKLRTLARPYMDNISLSFQGQPHIVILADREGYILDIVGTKDKFCNQDLGLWEGTCLSEEVVGVNGVGTCIKKGEPVLIYGNEHYSSKYKNLACYGVPIKNNRGQIIGVLELTTPKDCLNADSYTLLLLSVSSVETALAQIDITEAEERIKNMSNVVATAVHDLKNPLSIIQALTNLGSKKSDSAQVKDYFNRIDKQTKQLTNLLNNIILVSEPEEYTLTLPSIIIKNIINDLYPLADTNNISINFVNNNKVKVNLREKVFARAIYNILINAIDCINKKGMINVTITDERENILIKVQDNGPGIPQDIRENLFYPFISKREGGTGLGLYMVYQTITKVHQGEIWFETKENVGTTFYITVPYPDYCII